MLLGLVLSRTIAISAGVACAAGGALATKVLPHVIKGTKGLFAETKKTNGEKKGNKSK